MDASKALLKAAEKGDAAKVREWLNSGAAIEAVNIRQMTPLMLAAQGGHWEAFQALAESGANLHAVGHDIDVLEYAAGGGNAQVVECLLQRGLPVEGHWQPRTKVARRMGHMSPLIMAALHARPEIVRVLLRAGANREAKFDGQTALQFAQERLKAPADERQAELREVVRVLLASGSPSSEPPEDEALREIARFAEYVQTPSYRELRAWLEPRCGSARSWQPQQDHGVPAAGVVQYEIASCKEVETLQAAAREAHCQFLLSEPWTPGQYARLVLFPTANKLAPVAATGTRGANDAVRNEDILGWMQSTESENRFHLQVCGHDVLGGAFLNVPKNLKQIADELLALCPNATGAAALLRKHKLFLLRWD